MQKLTISMFRAAYPKELFGEQKREEHEIEETYSGIYYVTKDLPFPVQIVVTSELNPETSLKLKDMRLEKEK
jgi:hypothetical protein